MRRHLPARGKGLVCAGGPCSFVKKKTKWQFPWSHQSIKHSFIPEKKRGEEAHSREKTSFVCEFHRDGFLCNINQGHGHEQEHLPTLAVQERTIKSIVSHFLSNCRVIASTSSLAPRVALRPRSSDATRRSRRFLSAAASALVPGLCQGVSETLESSGVGKRAWGLGAGSAWGAEESSGSSGWSSSGSGWESSGEFSGEFSASDAAFVGVGSGSVGSLAEGPLAEGDGGDDLSDASFFFRWAER